MMDVYEEKVAGRPDGLTSLRPCSPIPRGEYRLARVAGRSVFSVSACSIMQNVNPPSVDSSTSVCVWGTFCGVCDDCGTLGDAISDFQHCAI